MPKISKYKKESYKDLKQKAYALYKQGLTLREIAISLNKIKSHEWFRQAIIEIELSTGLENDNT